MAPVGTKVEKCVRKMEKSGKADGYNKFAVCQKATGQSYATGKKLKKKK